MNNPLTFSQWTKLFTKIWCWIVGHNVICLKRFTAKFEEDNYPRYTTSAFQCLRCDRRWQEQWDE